LLSCALISLPSFFCSFFLFVVYFLSSIFFFFATSGTTNCYNYSNNRYGDLQGVADVFDIGSE
jgi:hypothetical protein